MHGCGFVLAWESAKADFRKRAKSETLKKNTIDCSPIDLNRLSSWILGRSRLAAQHTLSEALKTIRKARGLSQEAFSDVSSRTYMSSLERDLKSPTLNKLAELCEVMEVHPLTLLTLAYAGNSTRKADKLLAQVRQELEDVLQESGPANA